MNALEVDGVAMSFGATPVLRDVSLAVAHRSITAVLGSSGSGKTTMLRIIAGFERPTAGQVSLAGQLLEGPGVHVAPERRRLGFVPQDGALFPHLTVAGNVGFGVARSGRSIRIAELLDLVGLDGLSSRYPHELSGGQQQRVALARALAAGPAVILLDEPFASLDATLRASVRADIARVLRDSGTAAVLVTHDQQEALSMADQVVVLRDGRIAQAGPPRELYLRPIDAQLAAFLGDANLVDADVNGSVASTPFGPMIVTNTDGPKPITGPATVVIRPEQLALEYGHSPGGRPGRVVDCTYYGHDSMISVVLDDPCGADVIQVRITDARTYAPGTPVSLTACGEVTGWPRSS